MVGGAAPAAPTTSIFLLGGKEQSQDETFQELLISNGEGGVEKDDHQEEGSQQQVPQVGGTLAEEHHEGVWLRMIQVIWMKNPVLRKKVNQIKQTRSSDLGELIYCTEEFSLLTTVDRLLIWRKRDNQ